jgi:serine-type D-Ala-D-Ala carboxypeptidase (penicillin-binding protein 5/6)
MPTTAPLRRTRCSADTPQRPATHFRFEYTFERILIVPGAAMKSVSLVLLTASIVITLSACKESATPETASSSAAPVTSASPLESFNKANTAGTGAAAPVLPPGTPIPAAPVIEARGYVLMDYTTGEILAENNSNERMEPASLTKLMTAYITFDALRIGKIKLTDLALLSEHAWRTGGAATDGSTSFIPVNSQVPIETLLLGMIVQSGNDASIALAEHIAGNEDTFADLMRQYAAHLGMKNSSFGNATGLPSPLDYTTPHDMALLARALIRDFPQYYHYFSVKEFTFNNTTQHNRNGLLASDPGVDGLKTGHTENAGYCLVTSSKHDTMRLITVVMGTPSTKARETGTATLLNYGFSFYETKQLYAANQALQPVKVRKGQTDSVQLVPHDDVKLTVPRGRGSDIQTLVDVNKTLIAPLKKDQTVGALKLQQDGKELASYPLYPADNVAEAGFFGRMADSVKLWFDRS